MAVRMPQPAVEFTPPARPQEMSVRLHNKIVKDALRETMLGHQKQHTHRHFERRNKRLYAHAPRSKRHQERKRKKYGHNIDMVFTGATRQEMAGKQHHVTIGGTAEAKKKGITASYRMRFPFAKKVQQNYARRVDRSRKAGKTIAAGRNILPQLRREMERWAPDEQAWAVREFEARYMKKVNAWQGRRQRTRKPKP